MHARPAVRLLAAALLLGLAPQAWAASCQAGVTDLAFGTYRHNSDLDVEMQATVSIHGCVDDGSGTDVSYSIAISTGGSSSYGARAMAGPGDQLLYNLYTDATYGVVWGDGTGGSMTVDGAFSLPGVTSATHTAYGRIPRQQPVAAGAYSDTLGVTITY